LFIAGLGLLFSINFTLKEVISAILAMRILVQFVAQSIGVVLLRRKNKGKPLPFKMWLYPVPVVVSIIIWLYVFTSTGLFALWGSLLAVTGLIVYFIKSKMEAAQMQELQENQIH
jgi:amino acid transporter